MPKLDCIKISNSHFSKDIVNQWKDKPVSRRKDTQIMYLVKNFFTEWVKNSYILMIRKKQTWFKREVVVEALKQHCTMTYYRDNKYITRGLGSSAFSKCKLKPQWDYTTQPLERLQLERKIDNTK